MKFPLYYSKTINCYGLYYYVSTYTMKITGQTINTNPCLANVQKIVNFKNNNSGSAWFCHVLMEMAFNFLQCTDILAVPSSSAANTNNLQKLFDTKLERLFDVPKQNKFAKSEKADFNPLSIKLHSDKINGKKVLLIDDIAKTGETIIGCEKMLIEAGYEVKKLVLGLNYNLIFNKDEKLAKQARTEHHKNFIDTVYKEVDIIDFTRVLAPTKQSANNPFVGDFVFDWFKMPFHECLPDTLNFLEQRKLLQENGKH